MKRGYHRRYSISSWFLNRWSKKFGSTCSLITVDVSEWEDDEVIYAWIIFDLWPWFPSFDGWYRDCSGIWTDIKRWWRQNITNSFVPKEFPVKNWDEL